MSIINNGGGATNERGQLEAAAKAMVDRDANELAKDILGTGGVVEHFPRERLFQLDLRLRAAYLREQANRLERLASILPRELPIEASLTLMTLLHED